MVFVRRFIPSRLIPLILAMCLVLSACVRTHTIVKVHPADLISLEMQIRMNKELARQSGTTAETITEELKAKLKQDVPEEAQALASFTPIEEEDWVGTKFTTVPLPASEMTEYVQYTREGTKAKVVLPVKKYNSNGELSDQPGLKATGAEARLSVEMPGKILDTNGIVEGNTVTWDLLTTTSDPYVEAQVGLEWWLIALIAIAVIFVAVLLVWSLTKYYRQSRKVSPALPEQA